jgi:hypothetical protein
MSEQTITNFGRKVFFLYPHSVIQEDLVKEFFRMEYEVYTLKNHDKVKQLLKKHNDSIIFINIDAGLKPDEWKTFIKSIMSDPATEKVQVGILTYNENKALAQYYLMELMITGGFITLKLGLKQSRDIILKTLQASEAKGQRQFVRAKCKEASEATLNIKVGSSYYAGNILDISAVGMACVFDDVIELDSKKMINDIQLRIRGSLCLVNGKIAGVRKAEKDIYVIIFDPKLQESIKAKLKDIIYKLLQYQIDQELNKL